MHIGLEKLTSNRFIAYPFFEGDRDKLDFESVHLGYGDKLPADAILDIFTIVPHRIVNGLTLVSAEKTGEDSVRLCFKETGSQEEQQDDPDPGSGDPGSGGPDMDDGAYGLYFSEEDSTPPDYHHNFSRVNPDGSIDTTFNSPSVPGRAIYPFYAYRMLGYTYIMAETNSGRGIYRLDNDGNMDDSFNAPTRYGFIKSDVRRGARPVQTPENRIILDLGRLRDLPSPFAINASSGAMLPNPFMVFPERDAPGTIRYTSPVFQYSAHSEFQDEVRRQNSVEVWGGVYRAIFEEYDGVPHPYGGYWRHKRRVRISRFSYQGAWDNNLSSDIKIHEDDQISGRILMCRQELNGSEYLLIKLGNQPLRRMLSNDTYDDEFDNYNESDSVGGIELDSKGRIILHSMTTFGEDRTPYVVRLEPDGTIDDYFDLDIESEGAQSIECLAVQPDNKILVAYRRVVMEGYPWGDNNFNFPVRVLYVSRFNEDGSIDTSFSRFRASLGFEDDYKWLRFSAAAVRPQRYPAIESMVIDEEGRITIAGAFASDGTRPDPSLTEEENTRFFCVNMTKAQGTKNKYVSAPQDPIVARAIFTDSLFGFLDSHYGFFDFDDGIHTFGGIRLEGSTVDRRPERLEGIRVVPAVRQNSDTGDLDLLTGDIRIILGYNIDIIEAEGGIRVSSSAGSGSGRVPFSFIQDSGVLPVPDARDLRIEGGSEGCFEAHPEDSRTITISSSCTACCDCDDYLYALDLIEKTRKRIAEAIERSNTAVKEANNLVNEGAGHTVRIRRPSWLSVGENNE